MKPGDMFPCESVDISAVPRTPACNLHAMSDASRLNVRDELVITLSFSRSE